MTTPETPIQVLLDEFAGRVGKQSHQFTFTVGGNPIGGDGTTVAALGLRAGGVVEAHAVEYSAAGIERLRAAAAAGSDHRGSLG